MIFNGLSESQWEHIYADEFFDIIVEWELSTFGKRVMPEDDIYVICYDNAVKDFHESPLLDPVESARKAFDGIINLTKESNAKS